MTILQFQHEKGSYLGSNHRCHAITPRCTLKRRSVNVTERNKIEAVTALMQTIPDTLQKSVELAFEKGASTWLTTLPIEEHGFSLHKQAFRNALCVCYGWTPTRLPTHCSCGAQFNTTHALSCSKGAFPSIRHDRIRDLSAQLLFKVCSNVEVKPPLQPLTAWRNIYQQNSQHG